MKLTCLSFASEANICITPYEEQKHGCTNIPRRPLGKD
jgi:hypothetical protein